MILGMYVTRSKQHVWLIGDPLENILGTKLPSGRDVMRNLVHYHRVKNVNIQDAANRVYTQIIPMWEKARIPAKAKQDVIIKIKDLYNERQLLNKHRQRTTPANLRNQVEYTRRMYALFDIAHADADFLIKIDEDQQFLHQQRVDQSGSFGSFDKSLAICERTAATRAADRARTIDRHTAPQQTTDRDRCTRINRDKRSSSPYIYMYIYIKYILLVIESMYYVTTVVVECRM